MASHAILSWMPTVFQTRWHLSVQQRASQGGNSLVRLAMWGKHPERLPDWVQASPTAMRYLALLAPLAWEGFPERTLEHPVHAQVIPWATLAAACLVKLEEGLTTMPRLRRFLREHPPLIWLLGFPRQAAHAKWGFNPDASLPSSRHFARLLRQMLNASLQWLLDSSVSIIQRELADMDIVLGETISLDTKHSWPG